MRAVKVWRITKVVVGAIFLVIALFLGCLVFLRGREIHGYRKAILLELPVDLSKAGSQYRGTVNHIWDHYAHGVTLRIDTPKGYSSIEGAQQALKGVQLRMKWMTPGNGKPIEYVADSPVVRYTTARDGRPWPVISICPVHSTVTGLVDVMVFAPGLFVLRGSNHENNRDSLAE